MLIIAHDFDPDSLTTLVVNKLQQGLRVCAIKAPMLNPTDYLEDVAAFTGSTLLSPETGYTRLDRADPVYVMGKASSVTITSG